MNTPSNFNPINKMEAPTKSLFAVISTFLSIWAISSHWLFVSEFVKRHPGTTLVLFGVAGEGIELWLKIWRDDLYKKYERKIDVFGFIFWIIVVIGLAWEVPDAAKTDKESADLNRANLLLRSNVAALELQVQWRTIGKKDKLAISAELIAAPKGPVLVQSDWGDPEARFFADDIREVLTNAGFWMDSDTLQMASLFNTNGAVMFCMDPNRLLQDALPVQTAFRKAGYLIRFEKRLDAIFNGRTDHGTVNSNTLIIWISHKP